MLSNSARYSRQMILSEIGEKGQARLSLARVLVVGAGGLGCPALQYLAGAGIGSIGIIDHDQVDITNLHRQVLFTDKDAGAAKACVAGERVAALNPDTKVEVYDTELTDQNAPELFSGYDVILDGTDNFAAKYLINDVAVKLRKPVVYGAIQRFDGQVSVFDSTNGPCYRCLYPQPPSGAVLNCAEAGVIGALAGIIGTIQAMEVIKMVVADPSFRPLRGKLWMIDSKTMETRLLDIPKAKDCPVCSRPPAEIIPRYASPVCSAAMVREITCDDLPDLANTVMIDVREREEWDHGHIPHAQHLPLSVLRENPEMFSPYRHSTCVLYCQRGMRSRAAAEILLSAGFNDIYSLTGGFSEWCSRKS